MFAVIYVPNFALQACLRDPHETRPTALVASAGGKVRIIALNTAAVQQQVEVGMTVAQGQARCGDLVVHHRSVEVEGEAQGWLRRLAVESTPDFEDTAPGICTLDLIKAQTGCEWELGWALVERLATDYQLRAQVGVAATPDLALLVAQQADPVQSIIAETGRDFLLQLPIQALEMPPDISMVLTLWGVSTVADFLELSEGDLLERLGPEAQDWRERLAGKKSRLLRLVRPPADFSTRVEFEHEITTLQPLLAMAECLLETLCARLAAVWLAAGEIRLQLQLANGSGYQRDFRIPDPSTDVGLLWRVLQVHFENFTLRSPIEVLILEVVPTKGGRRQRQLFESGLRDPHRFADTLARLEAMLGAGRVGVPELLDSHRADAFSVRPYLEVERGVPDPSVTLGLPLRRFRPPIFAEVTLQQQRPVEVRSSVATGRVVEHRGPWKASGDWWRGQDETGGRWSRVEWDIAVATGGLYRLVCEGESDWRFEGIYG